jgi:hypothetical protein
MIELKTLCAAYGIGVIQLDINSTDNHKIFIPAKENLDLSNYIANICYIYENDKILPDDWDISAG